MLGCEEEFQDAQKEIFKQNLRAKRADEIKFRNRVWRGRQGVEFQLETRQKQVAHKVAEEVKDVKPVKLDPEPAPEENAEFAGAETQELLA